MLHLRFRCAVHPKDAPAFLHDLADMDAIALNAPLLARVGDIAAFLPDHVFTVAHALQKSLHFFQIARYHRDVTTAVLSDGLEVLLGAQLAVGHVDEILLLEQFPQLLPIWNRGCHIGLVAIIISGNLGAHARPR